MSGDCDLVYDVSRKLGLSGPAEQVALGQSNEVWLGSDWVLRIGGTGADDSLLTESQVVRQLPPAVGYPQLIGTGRTSGRCWMATERLAGQNLEVAWPRLTSAERATAVRDLWARIEAVHETALELLPALAPTPLYALDFARAAEQIALVRPTVGRDVADRLTRIVDAGLDALDRIGRGLVHSDAGFGNAAWDGRSAVPVDFEFACVGPIDLDLERLARETWRTAGAPRLGVGREIVSAAMDRPGGAVRLRCYAVLYDLWAYGRWQVHAPTAPDKQSWEPTQNLVASAEGTAWIDRVMAEVGGR